MKNIFLIVLATCCLAFTACEDEQKQANLADLEPLPDSNGFFCVRHDISGKLLVTVKNSGTGTAEASVVKVDFYSFGSSSQAVPELAPGAAVELTFDFPVGSFNPDCEFKIIVDADGTLPESDETNNVGEGDCIG